MKRWYVVHAHARAEAKALFNLTRQGFSAYLPRYLKRRRHARRTECVPSPLFPRYLFVSMDIEAVRWRAIQSTFGVAHLVCHGDRPTPVPEGAVEEIRAREDVNGMVELRPLASLKKGDRVEIVSGALADQVGLFDEIVDSQRVVILLKLLGRQVRVRVPEHAMVAVA